MSETRSGGARKRAKAKARAAAAAAEMTTTTTTPEPKQKASAVSKTATDNTTAIGGGGKKANKAKGKSTAAEAPPSPSPQKKKKRKRIHKRKGSVVDAIADAAMATPVAKKQNVQSTSMAKKAASEKPSTRAVAKDREVVSPATPEAALGSKRTRKRKTRSGSIAAQEEEEEKAVKPTTKAQDRQIVHVVSATQPNATPKKQTAQAAVQQAPKGRTTRAALAAAAAAEAAARALNEPTPMLQEDAAPTSASKSKKRRKSKTARAASTDSPAEPTPEPHSKAPEPIVAIRKSARLATDDAMLDEQLLPVRPMRKIISFAKVKGTTPKESTVADVEAHEELKEGNHTAEAKQPVIPTSIQHGNIAGHETDVQISAETEMASNPTPVDKPATPPSVAVSQDDADNEAMAAQMVLHPPGLEDEDEAPAEAMLDGGLAFLSGAGMSSSVESVADDESYQADILNEVNEKKDDEQATSSEREEELDHTGQADVPIVSNSQNEPSVGDVHMDDDDESVGSIDGSEAFTLEEVDQGEDVEYESLGIANSTEDTGREGAIDVETDDDGEDNAVYQSDEDEDEDEFGLNASRAVDQLQSQSHRGDHHDSSEGDRSDEDERDRSEEDEDDLDLDGTRAPEAEHPLDESFVDEEGEDSELTDSDDDQEFGRQTDASGVNEWPGLQSSTSHHPPAENEVIELSDTDSDEGDDSTSAGVAVQHDDEAMESDDEEDSDEDVDNLYHETYAGHAVADHTVTTDRQMSMDESATQFAAVNEERESIAVNEEDLGNESVEGTGDIDMDHEDPTNIQVQMQRTDNLVAHAARAAPMESPIAENQYPQHEHPTSSDEDQESANESDGTIDLQDEEDNALRSGFGSQHAETAEVANVNETDGVEEHRGASELVDVHRTLFAPLVSADPSPQTAITGQKAPSATIRSNATEAVEDKQPSQETNGRSITYSTTPSKHLIDSVFSTSRQQTLASITQAAMATPVQPKNPSMGRAWGPSFGVSESLNTSLMPADIPSQAAASPLSSWFFSRGPANFKKRVLIPSSGSPRQRVGSPRPLKMMRVEAATAVQASANLLDQAESGVDRFVQDLLDKSSWRSWYTKTKPDQLLDAPLPIEMIKRLGGDAAVALFSQTSLSVTPPEPTSDSVAIPKTRKRALAQLEASIQEEKTRTKAFDEELLQLLQGKTLSGQELTDEFARLLPPTIPSQR